MTYEPGMYGVHMGHEERDRFFVFVFFFATGAMLDSIDTAHGTIFVFLYAEVWRA